jgi:hypothetical protein
MAELEAHGPAAQISLIELFFRGILEIGARMMKLLAGNFENSRPSRYS